MTAKRRYVFVPDGLYQARMLGGLRTSWWDMGATARDELLTAVHEGRWPEGIAALYKRVAGEDVLLDTGSVMRHGPKTFWRR